MFWFSYHIIYNISLHHEFIYIITSYDLYHYIMISFISLHHDIIIIISFISYDFIMISLNHDIIPSWYHLYHSIMISSHHDIMNSITSWYHWCHNAVLSIITYHWLHVNLKDEIFSNGIFSQFSLNKQQRIQKSHSAIRKLIPRQEKKTCR